MTTPFLPSVILVLLLWCIPEAQAQTNFSLLHEFTRSGYDGIQPTTSLTVSESTIYGTTGLGGTNGYGTIFKVNTDGSGYATLHSFGGIYASHLTLLGTNLYGTTGYGANLGTIFRIGTNGLGFTNLHRFSGGDGEYPSGLTACGQVLYGTAERSGNSSIIFKINADGTGFATLAALYTAQDEYSYPKGDLLFVNNKIYGTTFYGGHQGASAKNGTVFVINTNGSGLKTLHTFTNSPDGKNPNTGLTLAGNTIYGTTDGGGSLFPGGTVFRINVDGSDYQVLYCFEQPFNQLLASGEKLYGTSLWPGPNGAVLELDTNGTVSNRLHTFSAYVNSAGSTNSDGAEPECALVMANNVLYGTTQFGGRFGQGTVFAVRVASPIPLQSQLSGNNLVLTWTNALFSLQSAPAPFGVFSNLVGATSPFTNAVSGRQGFYRLVAPSP